MSDHPIIATPHGFEAVEAVVQYDGTNAAEVMRALGANEWDIELTRAAGDAGMIVGHWYVWHHTNTVTVHDTDPRIEPTWAWGTKDRAGNVRGCVNEEDARYWAGVYRLVRYPTYPVTLAGKPYMLVGEWVEVED